MKKELLNLIGLFPKKVDLQSKIIESEDCGRYIREKIEYTALVGRGG